MYQNREYAVTVTAAAASLDAFEAALDHLPEGCLLGSDQTGCAALVFTVAATDPLAAVARGLVVLREEGVEVPDGASLTVLEHRAEVVA